MSVVRVWARGWLELIDRYLQAYLFLLMVMGLVLSSGFLWKGMITGSDWVAVCGILFGSNAIGGGISQFARSRATGNG